MAQGLCPLPGARLLLATDLDGTLLGPGYGLDPEAVRLLRVIHASGAPVALVTSKTLEEARLYAARLGLRGCPGYAIIAEEGGVIEAPGLLPGGRVYTARPLSPAEALELVPGRCRDKVKPIQWMTPGEVSRLTGLPLDEAEAARLRRVVAALHGPRECLEEAMDEALARGLYARLGRVFLMVGRIGGKAAGLRFLVEEAPGLRGAALAALGDDKMDEEMLAMADYAFVIPRESGPAARPPGLRYLVTPEPAPRGAAWALALLGLSLVHGLGPGDALGEVLEPHEGID